MRFNWGSILNMKVLNPMSNTQSESHKGRQISSLELLSSQVQFYLDTMDGQV